MQRIAIAAVVALFVGVAWSAETDRYTLDQLRALVQQPPDPPAEYRPQSDFSLSAVDTPVASILQDLPGVVGVKVSFAEGPPQQRIIHLMDWHFLPRNLFAADLRATSGRDLSEEEIDALYEQHLLEVELVQSEQMELLRCMLRHHGLRTVFVEGLTDEDALLFRIKIRVMRKTERQLQDVRQMLAETRGELQQLAASSEKDSADHRELIATQRQLEALLRVHRLDLLQIGAAGQLMLRGELDAVLPADDLEAWRRANPVDENGDVRLDRALNEQRENATVKKLLAASPCAVVIFGGLHDLSDNIQRLSQGSCEYLRVTTRWYRQFTR